MKLYHFCCDHVAPRVRLHGLSIGRLLLSRGGRAVFRSGYVWLTGEPDWGGQRWADKAGLLPCDRTDFRLTLNLPDGFSPFGTLRDWEATKRVISLLSSNDDSIRALERPGSDQWYTFEGRIPTSWILAVDENPKRRIAPLGEA